MTKDKKIDLTKWAVCILAALAFGAYLGSPVPKVWAQPVSEVITVVSNQMTVVSDQMTELSEQIRERKNLHKESMDNKISAKAQAAEESTEDFADPTTEAAIEIIVSEPPAEKQPDYILSNANRGGIADRKEKDVLIHLINAEAYGLSYKAKVAVGQVVMNRWTGPYYGDDLMAIMTAPHQFTPIYNGSAYNKKIEADSIEAANAVLSGAGVTELTDDTYYFVNPDFTEDKTIEQKMEFVCEIEGLHFFKPPVK